MFEQKSDPRDIFNVLAVIAAVGWLGFIVMLWAFWPHVMLMLYGLMGGLR